MNTEIKRIRTSVRALLFLFILCLVISGLTAIPVASELFFSLQSLPQDSALYSLLKKVLFAVTETQNNFPFLFYGYDWLSFAHIIIAMAFIGPYREPVRNIWVIEFGMLACVCVIPFALIAGGLRGLPFWWRLIDCSFGIMGFIPLWICYSKIKVLEKLTAAEYLNTIF
jgi:hypothetical protein